MEEKSPAASSEAKEEIKKPAPSKGILSTKSRLGVGKLKQSNSVIGSTGTLGTSSLKLSKIPKRDISTNESSIVINADRKFRTQRSTLSSRTIGNQIPPAEKRFSLKKKSKTNIDITSRTGSRPPSRPVSRQKTIIAPSPTSVANLNRPQSPRISKASNIHLHTPRPSHSTPSTPKVGKSAKNPSSATIGSLSHRAGEIPSYLKKADKSVTEAVLNSKKRALNSQKKKLTELQTDFLTNYKSLQEVQDKLNQISGKNERIEEVKLLGVVDGEVGELLIKDGEKILQISTPATPTTPTKPVPLRRRSQSPPKSTILTDFETIRPKLLLIHEAGFKLCQEFVDNFDKIQSEKEVHEEVGDCGANLQKQILQILKNMEEKIVNEENEQKKLLTEVILELQTAVCKKHGNVPDRETRTDDQAQLDLLKQKELEISSLSKELEEHKKKLEISDSRLKELGDVESGTVKALKTQVAERDSRIAEKEQEIIKTKDTLRRIEEQFRKTEKKSLSVTNDLVTKEGILTKLEADLEELRKRNKSYESIIEEVKRQKEGILDVVRKEQESRRLYERESELRKRLETELDDKEVIITKLRDLSKKNMVDKETAIYGGGDRSSYETKLFGDLQTMKASVERLNKEKSLLEKDKEELTKRLLSLNREDLKLELVKANDEVHQLNTANACLRDNISRLESTVSKKVAIINELERKIANGQYLANASKELQNEINNLREAQSERNREIDNLKAELSKAHVEIKQQEETICMHQRLLRIRSELINSLQEKEASNRCRMDDLYSEISKKTSLVNQMNHEISAKAEELQNLFSTLGTKQLEVNRQEHIIKMLEENNERNQRLRVKQEERMARLENENAELKHLLSKYDSGLNEDSRGSQSDRSYNSKWGKSTKDEENVSTRDLYDFGRRKKRQKEIEVKKIQRSQSKEENFKN